MSIHNPVGISFLYQFDFGNRDWLNPGSNILSVTDTRDGDFDKANLTTESLRQVWRSADAVGWKEIVIRAEQISKIDTVGILGHNLTDEAVIQIQADYSDAFIVPAETKTIPWTKRNIALTSEFADEYEYYKIRILDPANPCGYVQVGRIVGGRAFTFGNNEDINADFSIGSEDMADQMKTEGFFRVSNERVKVRTLSVKFSQVLTIAESDDNYLGWMEMADDVGVTRPFLTILDRDDPGFGLFWAQMGKIPEIGYTINRYASWSMGVSEVF